jgi:hypothetical protein
MLKPLDPHPKRRTGKALPNHKSYRANLQCFFMPADAYTAIAKGNLTVETI